MLLKAFTVNMISNVLTTICESILNKKSIFWEKSYYLLYLLYKIFSIYDKYHVFPEKKSSPSGQTFTDCSLAFGDHVYGGSF